jgi:hypothetical protein
MKGSNAARKLAAMRKTFGGGRPVISVPCRYCGHSMGFRERRIHEPRCTFKPAKPATQAAKSAASKPARKSRPAANR